MTYVTRPHDISTTCIQGCSQRSSEGCCTSWKFTSTSHKICTPYILGKFRASNYFISYSELYCSSCLCTKSLSFKFYTQKQQQKHHVFLSEEACTDWRPPVILRASRNLFSGYIHCITISYVGFSSSPVWHKGCCYLKRTTCYLTRMTYVPMLSHTYDLITRPYDILSSIISYV